MSVVNLVITVDTSELRKVRGKIRAAETWASSRTVDFGIAGTQRRAPVDTANLWSKIGGVVKGGKWSWWSKASYAGYQEGGTIYQKGTPHVTPTFEEVPWEQIAQGVVKEMGL